MTFIQRETSQVSILYTGSVLRLL